MTAPPAESVFLNAIWRVGDDCQRWRFETRIGRRGRRRGSLWVTRGYFVERVALLIAIGELCGAVDGAALAIVHQWPATHPSPSMTADPPMPGPGTGETWAAATHLPDLAFTIEGRP